MIRKVRVFETLHNLPDEFSIDELFDRLLIIEKVERAEEQSKQGEKYPEVEARNKIKRWSK